MIEKWVYHFQPVYLLVVLYCLCSCVFQKGNNSDMSFFFTRGFKLHMTVIADERRSSLRYGMKEIVTSVDADLYEVGDYKQPAIDDHRSLLPPEILDQYKSKTREVKH